MGHSYWSDRDETKGSPHGQSLSVFAIFSISRVICTEVRTMAAIASGDSLAELAYAAPAMAPAICDAA